MAATALITTSKAGGEQGSLNCGFENHLVEWTISDMPA